MRNIFLGLLLANALAGPIAAQGPVDEATGRDLRNYPPHRYADFQHLRLDLNIPDMDQPSFEAQATLSLAPIGWPLDALRLNARLLQVHSVACDGFRVTSDSDGQTLDIAFDPPVPVGRAVDLVIEYTVTDPPDGLYWSPEPPADPSLGAQIYTQGEPETNSYWFPCHDFPNDRLTTEVIATVPAGYTVSSNGHLVAHTTLPTGAESWHWLQDQPHVPYLVSLVIGKFDGVDVGTPDLPMPVYIATGLGADVAPTFGRTPEMAALFTRLIDEPYPWDRYAQVLVRNFLYGGEENTSATTLTDTALLDATAMIDNDSEGLISHELAHQWFGDLVTCNSWEHIWLNEGFATYFTALWMQERDGPNGYDAVIRGNFDQVIVADRGTAPNDPAMVSKQYLDPFEVFGRSANPYSKGSAILHMLRRRVGDEPFFAAIARFVDEHRLDTVETDDLRQSFEDQTGESLERFFAQWCLRPGIPRLDIAIDWTVTDPTSGRGELALEINQSQPINGDNPAFEFSLPIWITGPGRSRTATINVDSTATRARFSLDAEPFIVAIDPNMNVLAELRITQPPARWLRQLADGPTLSSRIQAAAALAAADHADSRAALSAVVRDSHSPAPLRLAALAAIEKSNDPSRLLALAAAGIDAPSVRAEVIAAIARSETESPPSTDDLFAEVLATDESELVMASAVRALGKSKSDKALSLVLAAAGRDSHADRVRQAALQALAEMDSAAGMPVAIELSGPESISRTRREAINAIAALGHHDPDAAFAAILPLLESRDVLVYEAAGAALVKLDDDRALDALQQAQSRARGDRQERKTAEWLRIRQDPPNDEANDTADDATPASPSD